MVGKYNVGEVWWTHFPFQEGTQDKHRPAIVIDDDTIAILALYVTSQNKDIPYSIEISDWQEAGLKKPSWARS
jgi:mRNA-degrading endonuclease toxin of MazEF toxin-antitoxin module